MILLNSMGDEGMEKDVAKHGPPPSNVLHDDQISHLQHFIPLPLLSGWDRLRQWHQRGGKAVRSGEFALVAGLFAGGWAAGDDMFLALPLLLAGLIVGLVCTTSAQWQPSGKWTVSLFLIVAFFSEAGALYWHTHPSAQPLKHAATRTKPPGKSVDDIPIPKLSDLYSTDFPEYMRFVSGSTVTIIKAGQRIDTVVRLTEHFDMQSRMKFYSIYVPDSEVTFEICETLAKTFPGFLSQALDRIQSTGRIVGDSTPTMSKDLAFTGRL